MWLGTMSLASRMPCRQARSRRPARAASPAEVAGDRVVVEGVGRGERGRVAAPALDLLRGPAALPQADEPEAGHAEPGQARPARRPGSSSSVRIGRPWRPRELVEPDVRALGDEDELGHPGDVVAEPLGFGVAGRHRRRRPSAPRPPKAAPGGPAPQRPRPVASSAMTPRPTSRRSSSPSPAAPMRPRQWSRTKTSWPASEAGEARAGASRSVTRSWPSGPNRGPAAKIPADGGQDRAVAGLRARARAACRRRAAGAARWPGSSRRGWSAGARAARRPSRAGAGGKVRRVGAAAWRVAGRGADASRTAPRARSKAVPSTSSR